MAKMMDRGSEPIILVTGATGMTGQFVVRELLRRGHRVRALIRSGSANLVEQDVETVVGDLADTSPWLKWIRSYPRLCASTPNPGAMITLTCAAI